MNDGKKYVIAVGRTRIEQGLSGQLDRQSGQPTTKTEVLIPVGAYPIPSRSLAWGQRVIDGKPRANKSIIAATDPDYKGEIIFMKWGAQGGEKIEIQFLPGTSSLDRVYQEKRLNLLPTNEDSSIMLDQGINNLYFDDDDAKITFLKVCSMNSGSVSRDPKLMGGVFYEVVKNNDEHKQVKGIAAIGKAISLVSAQETKPENIKALFSIIGGQQTLVEVNDAKDETQIFIALMKFAQQSPDVILQKIEAFKKTVSDLFMKAETLSLLDYEIDGTIGMMVKEKKQQMFTDIGGKGKAMKDWVIENYYVGSVFQSIQNMQNTLDKIKL